MDDTGLNIPERLETLLIQQRQLVEGRRVVQMFPSGCRELPLPDGLERHANAKGVFHFRPDSIEPSTIDRLTAASRENEMLLLGPFNKADILAIVTAGEPLVVLVEQTPDGTEVRAAAAVPRTLPDQIAYFRQTMDHPDNNRVILDMVTVLNKRLDRGLSIAS